MHPPPPKEILERLISSDLELVSHGLYVIHLNFENGNLLSFSAPFRFAESQQLYDAPVLDFPLSESKLVRVVGCRVTQLECDTDGTLELQFSNGDVLIIYANDPNCEQAYMVTIGGEEYRV